MRWVVGESLDRDQTSAVQGLFVTGGFFDVLGVPAILGRTLTPLDDRRGGGPDGPVAMISYRFWQEHFGAAADALGKTITLDRVAFTVIGVTPPEFFGPEVGGAFDVAIPLGTEPLLRGHDSLLDDRSSWWLTTMVRLKPDQDLAQGTAAWQSVESEIFAATVPTTLRPDDQKAYLRTHLGLIPSANGASYLRDRYQRPLTILSVVVGLVLLIACANIANLLLARASARRHEFALRLALGASRLRLARQLIVESLVLSCCGAALGLLIANWSSRLLVRALSTRANQVFLDLAIDWRMLAFTAAIATATTLVFGVAPAVMAARSEPHDALRGQGRSILGESRNRTGSFFVVVQVALSLVLVVGAGLFVTTLARLRMQPLGFDREGILIASVVLHDDRVPRADRPAIFERLRAAAASVPGVASASASRHTPASGRTDQTRLETPLDPASSGRDRGVYVHVISPQFFATYGTRLIAGRTFTDADNVGAPPVVIVNETFARKYFGARNPLGQIVKEMPRPGHPTSAQEVVGCVSDVLYRNLRQPVPPTIYVPLPQEPRSRWPGIEISVRAAAGLPAGLITPIDAALNRQGVNLSVSYISLAEQVENSLKQERLLATLSGAFGALALLLAAIGLYGVTSYAVTRRRTELGIRIALGAEPTQMVTMLLSRVAVLLSIGLGIGTAATLWASRFVETLLFGLTPRDVPTLTAAAALLAAIGLLAAWLPARRAAHIDPATVLHES